MQFGTKKNLLRKYFVATAALIMTCVLILGGALCWQAYEYSISEKRQMLEDRAMQVADLTSNLLNSHNMMRRSSFEFVMSTMADGGKLHILICAPDGQVVMTSDDMDHAYKGVYVESSVISRLRESEYYAGVGNLGGLYKGRNYTVAVPTVNALGQHGGYVFVTTPMSSMRELLYDILYMFLFSAIAVFLLSAIMAYITMRSMTRPIKDISAAAKKFARGEFDTRVPLTRDDEIGEMVLAFNNMADSLEKSEELRRTFVSNVSHELRSPMTSIGGFVDGILDGTIPEDRQQHYLNIISSEVKRLSRLVSRMLDITRLQAKDVASECTVFDMCELVRRVILSFEASAGEKQLEIEVGLCDYRLEICANEDMIYQAVYNLTENAIKFSRPGSKVTISLAAKGGRVRFSIRNLGETIPPEQLPCVFDRFHKGDASRGNDKKGLGLGLYIVKTIINQHRGDVGVSSREGVTEFFFMLPQDSSRPDLTKHSS